jgi:hypothetical protein
MSVHDWTFNVPRGVYYNDDLTDHLFRLAEGWLEQPKYRVGEYIAIVDGGILSLGRQGPGHATIDELVSQAAAFSRVVLGSRLRLFAAVPTSITGPARVAWEVVL